MQPYFLRPVVEAERSLIFGIYKAAVGPYIAEAWGWDEAYQLSHFWQFHPFENFQVIQVGDCVAGGVHTEQDQTDLLIRMIFLAHEFQGLGIGSRLITDLHAIALDTGKGLGLKVLRTNRAKQLYQRLGFVVIAQDETSLDMRWS